jgi:hypothetical protein
MSLMSLLPPVLIHAEYPYQTLPLPSGKGEQILIGPRAYYAGGDYDKQRPIYLLLISQNSVTDKPLSQEIDTLQMVVQHPTLQIPAPQQGNVLRLMRDFNLVLPLGRYQLTPEGEVQFRYGWMLKPEAFEGVLLLDVLDTLWFYYDQLTWRLEAVAEGLCSLAEMREQALQVPTPTFPDLEAAASLLG